MSKFLRHTACEDCGSSDGLAVYTDHSFCFVCNKHERFNRQEENTIKHETIVKVPLSNIPQPGIEDRKISAEAVNKFKVVVDTNPESHISHVYPYFDEEGNHVANRIRRKGEKAFYWEGDMSGSCLFGQKFFRPGGLAITVTEGECDALAAYQMTGHKYPAVSVKSANVAKKDCADSFEYLNSFEKIVLAFDNDEPGQKAAVAVAQLFPPGKVHILKFEKGKDANEYLMNGWVREYTNEWHRAPAFMPDGIKFGSHLWDEIENHKDPESVPYPWEGLNRMTYGLRLSEAVILTADTGIGKTSIVKEIEHLLLTNPKLVAEGAGVGILHLEEPNYDTLIGLMSIEANKPFHLPDVPRSTEELRKHYDSVINNDRVVIYDHFGSNDVDTILSKIRHMAALGCKYIVLDHLTIIVSDHSGDERKQLDEISTKLKMLCMNLNIAVVAIIHQNRQGQIRGTAGVEQIANIVIKLYRDKTDPDPWRRNVTRLTVEKNRFCGRTGPACWLFYDETTGRLIELNKEQADAYEKGITMAGNEFDMYA